MPYKILDTINSPEDLRALPEKQLPILASELRDFIIDVVASKEGHLGASLGVIELTIALHYIFDTPNDLLVWDVGHQAYGHKIITGRRKVFHTNRQFGGISGFPNRNESVYDTFGVGHSSTSISATLGMAIASQLKGEDREHIAVIGDASIVSGMAFEALNHAGVTQTNILVILNDNSIGIDPSVGALKDHFHQMKSGLKNTIFEIFNFNYLGSVDGHNLEELITTFRTVKEIKGPKLLHVATTKGKGLKKAEENQVIYHAPGKFDKISGDRFIKNNDYDKFQDVFGKTLVELAADNDKIVGITPAMLSGSSLNMLLQKFPDRTFDVGIAEQHAVTLAAGMATQELVPFCNIYSTFLQRAYDQVIHDVALQKLPVIFCLDRAGLVGEDGATHHGVFDLAYLRCIPNMIIFAPRNEIELRNILYTSQLGLESPIAIRYPRGRGNIKNWQLPFEKIEIGEGVCLKTGNKKAVLSVGVIPESVVQTIQNSDAAHYDMRFIKPLDLRLLHHIFNNYDDIITIEDGTVVGGFGSAVLEFAAKNTYHNTIEIIGISDNFVPQGSLEKLYKFCNVDGQSISQKINITDNFIFD